MGDQRGTYDVEPMTTHQRMPPSRSNPPQSSPANRLRVGDCTVDVALREVIRADGSKTRITAKSMAVLVLLVEHTGQVVSRETLLESVWAGTLPTDDVVTQAVTQLRKALGHRSDGSAYVETIPKSGYRLLVDVEWLQDAGQMPQSEKPKTTAPRWQPAAFIAGAIAMGALAWSALHRGDPSPSLPQVGRDATTELPYILLTARPGPETQPALSPDGALVAYAMPPGDAYDAPAIFVQSIQPTPPRQLTTPPPDHSDHLPRWSPDGRQLMFQRIDEKSGCELHLMPSSGGPSRVVGRCDRLNGRYDWLPDGSGVVGGLRPQAEGDSGPLAALHLSSGEWTPLSYSLGAGDVDTDPRYSPDGATLAFRRNLSNSDLWKMPANGGSPERLTRLGANITGWDWMPDGRALLLGVMRNPPQLYRHDLASGRTQALGTFPASGLDIAAQRAVMVFAVDDDHIAMFRYPLPLRAGGKGEALFPSTADDLLPSPSPDGSVLAFVSNRSREVRLWLGEPERPDHLRVIEGIVPVARHPPQWSDDGRRLLVIGDVVGAAGNSRPKLHEVDVASGRARVIELEGAAPYFAQYLPDDRLLLVVDRGAGRLALRIVEAISPTRVLATLDDVGEARFDHSSGQVHFVHANQPGLWRVGLDLQEPVKVEHSLPAAYSMRRWGVLEGRPFMLRTAMPDCLANWRWMGEGGAAGGCLDRERRGVPASALMVSRDGKWLYASMTQGQEDSDIGLIELDALGGF